MKLYTDKGNYQALKCVIASNVISDSLEICTTTAEERPDVIQKGKLPILEHSDGKFIVSSNAACRYILAKKDQDLQDTEVDQLLDWESTTLQPVVHAVLASQAVGGKTDDKLLSELHTALGTLNEKLVKKWFLVAKRLTAADVVIWSTIYPLFCKHTPIPAEKNKHDAICTWYGKLLEVTPFANAVKTVFPEGSQEAMKK